MKSRIACSISSPRSSSSTTGPGRFPQIRQCERHTLHFPLQAGPFPLVRGTEHQFPQRPVRVLQPVLDVTQFDAHLSMIFMSAARPIRPGGHASAAISNADRQSPNR